MSDETELPPVTDDELLARFVLIDDWIRQDQTIKPNAFIPHPHNNLSVTRHLELSESELWQLGQNVADIRTLREQRAFRLFGRADIKALVVKRQSLRIEPTPEPKNHANITGWPVDKPLQKKIAQEIAVMARFIPKV